MSDYRKGFYMIQSIEIIKLHPHPHNPRKDLGELTELSDSIRERGVLQNLTVVPQAPGYCTSCSLFIRGAGKCKEGHDEHERAPCSKWESAGGYTVVIGHRRLAAAKLAGLTELPCTVVEMDERTQVATMLLENIQRTDLTVYEQAQGFQLMMDMGETVDTLAEKTGFSMSTVRRRLKMAELDQAVLKDVAARQVSLTDFDRLAQIDDLETRNKCLKDIGTRDFNQSVETQLRKQNIKKMLPIVKAAIKKLHANKIERSETYGGKYDQIVRRYFRDWNGMDPLVPAGETRKLFYYLDEDYGEVQFFVERPKAKPVKRPQEEIEREKRIAEAWAALKEKTAVSYNLRAEFVKGVAVSSRNMADMLKGATTACALHVISYVSTYDDRNTVFDMLGIDHEKYDPDTTHKALKALKEFGGKVIPAIIYAALGDSENNGYGSGYLKSFPEHKRNENLDALYDWLVSLGYQMSEEERKLRDGTHELFKAQKGSGNDEEQTE
ncbi:Nucleoid occlusion protein [bioreactor metagenome]|uniref:Nucleoid occlusion protein n=1 Tax=bioreactor metagenome TaxID=1076179 RepID=A0A644Y0B4_9ZZZZ